MSKQLTRSITEPIRTGLTWEETWLGPDQGLIWNWECGRQMRGKGSCARGPCGGR